MTIRDGFREVTSGWILTDDFDVLTEIIETSAEWTKNNRPLSLEEEAVVEAMLHRQVAMGIKRGDFEPYISRDSDPNEIFAQKKEKE